MMIEFPLEFLVKGMPVSVQAKRPKSKIEWQQRVRDASSTVIPSPHFASDDGISVTMYFLPADAMQGDIDNIIKPIIDALKGHIYIDDQQVERIVIQKFEPSSGYRFVQPSAMLAEAFETERPVLYVRISDNPIKDLV
jgi:crossover junction endodeoxyribonuclease RusA